MHISSGVEYVFNMESAVKKAQIEARKPNLEHQEARFQYSTLAEEHTFMLEYKE